MGAVVGALGDLGYGVAYRILDAQYHGVPQRRRRVFFVGHLGVPWSAPAEVLFELESSHGDSAAGGETGTGAAAGAATGAGGAVSVFGTHTHTLTASASKMVAEDGTGRGCPIVTGSSAVDVYNGVIDDDVTHTLRADEQGIPRLITHTHTHTISTLQGGGKRGYRIDAESAAGGHLVVGKSCPP